MRNYFKEESEVRECRFSRPVRGKGLSVPQDSDFWLLGHYSFEGVREIRTGFLHLFRAPAMAICLTFSAVSRHESPVEKAEVVIQDSDCHFHRLSVAPGSNTLLIPLAWYTGDCLRMLLHAVFRTSGGTWEKLSLLYPPVRA